MQLQMTAARKRSIRAGCNGKNGKIGRFPVSSSAFRLTADCPRRDNPGLRGLDILIQPHGENRVNTVAECTVPEKILIAAHQLETEGQSPFSAEALIVVSWQRFPKTFGLKGYADLYPDSNKVLSSIMGVKGLANRGWLVKMGQKLYSLTREGREVVRHILEGDDPAPLRGGMARLSREQEKFLLRQFETGALEKFIEGRKTEITFADACRFWDISEAMHGETVNGR